MNNYPLKILFLTSSYPRSQEDTASVFLRYLAGKLAKRGLDVHVLAPADGKGGTSIEGELTVHRFQYFPTALQALAYGSGIMPNLKRSPWLWLQVPFFLIVMTMRLVRLLTAQPFDVIHAHWILPQGIVGLLGAYLYRVPLVVTAHGTDAFALPSRFINRLKRLVITRSNIWTSNTPTTADAVIRNSYLPKPRIIPMGVDIAHFSNGNSAMLRRELAQGEFLILFVGRLTENKGCHDLLHAFSLLGRSTRTRTTLWVIGDGDQRIKLEQNTKHLSIQEKVRFLGTMSHQRLPDFYAAADLVVIPSIQGPSGEAEGQGVVILEAFAARACVLATRLGGICSVVSDHVTGVLVEPSNPKALAGAMEQLLLDPNLRKRLADTAFADVNARYGWERIAGKFEKLYREASKSSAVDA